MGRILRAGAIAGGLGGVALALALRVVGEGPLNEAVARERAASVAGAHQEMLSRGVQQAGGMLGAIVFGVCVGLVLATVLAVARHRLPQADDWRRSVTLAATGFVTIALVPALKYPANPPGIGSPNSIGRRTALYLVMLVWSVLCTASAWRFWRSVSRRVAVSAAVPVVLAAYVALVVVALVVLPGTGDPITLPATLVWRFRLASIGGAAAFWTVTGLALGALLERERQRSHANLEPVGFGHA